MAATVHDDDFWEIALAVNAAVKGLLGSQGQSGHICERTLPLAVELEPERALPALVDAVVDALGSSELRDGDVVVVPDKLFAVAQGRIGPPEILTDPDPKKISAPRREELARRWSERLGFPMTPLHLLLADQYRSPDGRPMAALGTWDHNGVAAALSADVNTRLTRRVDVIISDTDTGLDVRWPLIGVLTIGATPLGVTRGLNLYEAMRCACAAEFTRGHTRRVPVVICRPAVRLSAREFISEHRGYSGAVHISHEPGITYT
jgi:F420-0:gamma-glutamyl ligase